MTRKHMLDSIRRGLIKENRLTPYLEKRLKEAEDRYPTPFLEITYQEWKDAYTDL